MHFKSVFLLKSPLPLRPWRANSCGGWQHPSSHIVFRCHLNDFAKLRDPYTAQAISTIAAHQNAMFSVCREKVSRGKLFICGYITYSQDDTGGAFEGQGETMPEDLKLAVLILIGGYFNQKQNMGVKSYSIQGMNVTFRDKVEAEQFEQIVKRYKKTVISAI